MKPPVAPSLNPLTLKERMKVSRQAMPEQDAAQRSSAFTEVNLGYSPELDRFMVLGGRTTWADYKQPRSYDVLTLDLASHALAEAKWENAFPPTTALFGWIANPVR